MLAADAAGQGKDNLFYQWPWAVSVSVLKWGDENEATVACMGQGSFGAVMKLCTSYWDFSALFKEDTRTECSF